MDSGTGDLVPTPPFVLLESYGSRVAGWAWLFTDPLEVVVSGSLEDIPEALFRIEEQVRSGRHAAGYIGYEAAPAFDPAMQTRPFSDIPLIWFGIFRERTAIGPGVLGPGGPSSHSGWTPSLSREAYEAAFQRIQAYITGGETYQVNFTLRLRATWEGDAFGIYRRVCRSQRAPYCAYIDLGRHKIVSASPELFFDRREDTLKCRPMKGTRPRGRWFEEDEGAARLLHMSPKDRSENVMIVDLLRNDMGRVSEPGSVRVESLFEVERYETVLQMTSMIRSRIHPEVGLWELMAALFPCGSVTGAPKIRTMEIISELEDSPRGIYTGSIGYVSPGPEAVFNVAIRTILLDGETGTAELGVGGGITHYSEAGLEYDECLTKARFLDEDRPEFDLLETILWEGGEFFLLERHLDRMERSARYFGYPFDRGAVRKALDESAARLSGGCEGGPQSGEGDSSPVAGRQGRVRLLLSPDGRIRCEESPLAVSNPRKPYRAALAKNPVDCRNPFLFHKTTHRRVYGEASAGRPDCDDVLLWNERGEITESTIANVVLVIDGTRWTPPVECGLLPGVYREELLKRGELRERVLSRKDLERAEAVYLVNSVRREWLVRVLP